MTALDHLRHVLSRITEVLKTVDLYSTRMTNDVHALYSRAMSRRGFISDMAQVIDAQLNEAWIKGADESMVLPEDFTDEDKAVLQGIIDNEKSFLDGFADDIQNAAAERTGWEQFQSRIDIWVNRYGDVQNRAKIYFGAKIKYRWDLGPTEQHCETGIPVPNHAGCKDLAGIVMWAEEWDATGIKPHEADSQTLSCHGYNCQCELNSTTERRTRNGFARVMGMLGR